MVARGECPKITGVPGGRTPARRSTPLRHAGQAVIDALDRGIRTVAVHLDNQVELVGCRHVEEKWKYGCRPSALARIDPDLLARSGPHRALEEAVWREANVGSSRSGPPGGPTGSGKMNGTRMREVSTARALFLPWAKSCSWCGSV